MSTPCSITGWTKSQVGLYSHKLVKNKQIFKYFVRNYSLLEALRFAAQLCCQPERFAPDGAVIHCCW